MNKNKVFHITVYSDPGHSWGKVKKSVLTSLGIADKVTPYSYQYADNVYLEEDCDLSLLVEKIKSHGTRIIFKEKHTERQSRIRSYQPYTNA